MNRPPQIAATFGLVSLAALSACGPKPIDPHKQLGPDPYLPAIHQYLLPPMAVSKVVGWHGARPEVPAGMRSRRWKPD